MTEPRFTRLLVRNKYLHLTEYILECFISTLILLIQTTCTFELYFLLHIMAAVIFFFGQGVIYRRMYITVIVR